MDLSTIANIATALTVLTAVGFGMIEMRRARRDREERAAFELIRSHMTPQWLRSAVIVQGLPVDANAEQIENNPQVLEAVHSIGLILEAIGYAVFIGIVPLRMVDQFMGGIVRVASNRMRRYIEFERARSGSQKGWEWFQWLSEQIERYGSGETNLLRGAHEAYRDRKPGDKELALQQLEAGLRAPAASVMLSYGALKLHPLWDPLRGDPRFEKIVAELAPK